MVLGIDSLSSVFTAVVSEQSFVSRRSVISIILSAVVFLLFGHLL